MLDWTARTPPILRLARLTLLFLAAYLALSAVDHGIVRWIVLFMPELRLGLFLRLTELGDATFYLVPSALVALLGLGFSRLVRERRPRAVAGWIGSAGAFVFTSVALSGVAVNLLKALVGRGRPILEQPELFVGFEPLTLKAAFHSFPSGHAGTVFGAATALGLVAPPLRLPLLVLAALAASPRIATTVHFASDVLGGAAIAVLVTFWLRDRWAERGWVFARGPEGRIALRWPGRLLGVLARPGGLRLRARRSRARVLTLRNL